MIPVTHIDDAQRTMPIVASQKRPFIAETECIRG